MDLQAGKLGQKATSSWWMRRPSTARALLSRTVEEDAVRPGTTGRHDGAQHVVDQPRGTGHIEITRCQVVDVTSHDVADRALPTTGRIVRRCLHHREVGSEAYWCTRVTAGVLQHDGPTDRL